MESVRRLAIVTTVATLLLVVVGGLVRGSGAGLGCPDWPRCFGQWIPPTSAADVPDELRDQFNLVKCWTEYCNRLIGVSVGFLVLATTVQVFRRAKRRRDLVVPIAAALLLVGFQGWLGGQVVGSELEPFLVSAHLFLAVVVVWLLVYAAWASFRGSDEPQKGPWPGLAVATTVVVTLQLVLGALVRGRVDVAVTEDPTLPRAEWLQHAAPLDIVHRESALLVAVLAALTWWSVERSKGIERRSTRLCARAVLALLAGQLVAGVVLSYGDMPATGQIVHVSLGVWLASAVFLLALLQRSSPRARHVTP